MIAVSIVSIQSKVFAAVSDDQLPILDGNYFAVGLGFMIKNNQLLHNSSCCIGLFVS